MAVLVVVVVVWRETQHLTVLTVAADLGRLMRVTVTGKRDSRRLGGTKRLEKLRDCIDVAAVPAFIATRTNK